MRHFVYLTICPESGRFYFGKHSGPKFKKNYQGSGLWVKQCKAKGRLLFTTIVSEFGFESEAFDFERRIIALFRNNPLCMNFADGGEGQTSEFLRKVLNQPHVKVKLQAAALRSSGCLGKTWRLSDSDKETHRLATIKAWKEGRMKGSIGHKHNATFKLRMGGIMKDRKFSDETRMKMSIAAKARAERDGRVGVGLFVKGVAAQ